jgi:hypothetical protein
MGDASGRFIDSACLGLANTTFGKFTLGDPKGPLGTERVVVEHGDLLPVQQGDHCRTTDVIHSKHPDKTAP